MLARAICAALVAAVLVIAAVPAGANELAGTVSCDTATVHAVRYPPGLHLARALLTVEGETTALADRAWSGPEAVLTWDVSALTDRPGVLAVSIDVATDTGATLHAAASLRCQEQTSTTTTTVPPSTTTTEAPTTTLPVTTTSSPSTAPQSLPEPPSVSPPPTLPRTGSDGSTGLAVVAGLLVGCGLVLAAGFARGRRA